MNAVEVYARIWVKCESADVNYLSEWVKVIRSLVKRDIRHRMSTKYVSIFKDPHVNYELSKLHDKFIFVPADKASNNNVLCGQNVLFAMSYSGTWSTYNQGIIHIYLQHFENLKF